MAIEFLKTTLQKEGTLQVGDVTYNINVTATNNELTRLHCGIAKIIVVQQPDGLGGQTPIEEKHSIGHITLEYGRQLTEIIQWENIIPHITKFQEILDEVLGNTPVTTDAEKATIKK